ncbi:hypothetical protein [Pseudonocardia alni]|uniref:hypothetical protein n=1 Tax=Pseudonocardia alni TaxID=33907 RepID=UPI00341117DC
MASVAAWLLFGVLELVVGFGAIAPSDGESEVDRVRDELGSPAVSTSAPLLDRPVAVVVGLVLLAAALLLLAGRGSVRYVAAVAGVVGVLDLAVGGRFETGIAIVLLVVGIVPLMLPSVYRFLSADTHTSGTGRVWTSSS